MPNSLSRYVLHGHFSLFTMASSPLDKEPNKKGRRISLGSYIHETLIIFL